MTFEKGESRIESWAFESRVGYGVVPVTSGCQRMRHSLTFVNLVIFSKPFRSSHSPDLNRPVTRHRSIHLWHAAIWKALSDSAIDGSSVHRGRQRPDASAPADCGFNVDRDVRAGNRRMVFEWAELPIKIMS
jgi:hypothetical protein